MTRRKFQGTKRVDEASTSADVALINLETKLRAWLLVQPEWVFVLASDRHVRRRWGRMVGDTVTRLSAGMRLVPREEHDDALD